MRSAVALGVIVIFAFSAPTIGVQKDKDVYAQFKISFDELKNEVVVLERQVRALQESHDKNMGQMSTLITQIIDNVGAIRQAQSRVAEGSNSAINAVNGIDEKVSAVNQRIDRVSNQLAELKKLDDGSLNFQFAEVYAQRGELELAVTALESAYLALDTGLQSLYSDPLLEPVRRQPRVQTLLKRLQLPT